MRDGVYCCVIHEKKHIVDILCSHYFSQQRNKFIYEKMFFPNLGVVYTASLLPRLIQMI